MQIENVFQKTYVLKKTFWFALIFRTNCFFRNKKYVLKFSSENQCKSNKTWFFKNPNCFFLISRCIQRRSLPEHCRTGVQQRDGSARRAADWLQCSSAKAAPLQWGSGMRVSLILFDDFPDFPKIWHLQTAVTLQLLDRFHVLGSNLISKPLKWHR